jgi:APA family basic amino acid/polyamine antiporter
MFPTMASELKRGLNDRDALALVIGTVIGTGVFLKTATMTQSLQSPVWVLAAWLFAGLLSIAGALTYAEIGARFPRAGGEFVYLHEAYGRFPAFLYGWMRFGIGAPGSIAAYAVGAASFIGMGQSFAVAMIVLFTILNCFQVSVGGGLQTFLTFLKMILTLGLALVLIFGVPSDQAQIGLGVLKEWFHPDITPRIGAFGAAVLAALWAYDGWNNLPMAAGEVKDANRAVPKALVFGILAVFLIYALLNFAYFYVLPLSEVVQSNSTLYPDAPPVAARAASVLMGPASVQAFSFALLVSALGAMNGSILTGARVPYAMSKEKLFFPAFSSVHPRTQVPMFSILIQGAISCALALTGTFDQLTDMVIFSSWIFYALVGSSVFIFRRRDQTLKDSKANELKKEGDSPPFRVPGYPIVPIVFIGLAILLVVNTLITQWRESLYGIGYLALGSLIYLSFLRPRVSK